MHSTRNFVRTLIILVVFTSSNGQDDCPWNWNITAGSTCDDYDPISQCLFDASRNVRKDCAENSDKECRRSSSFSCRSDCQDFHTACCCPPLSQAPTDPPTQLPTISAQPSFKATSKPTLIPSFSQRPSRRPTLRPTGTPTTTPTISTIPTSGSPTWTCPFYYFPAMECDTVRTVGECYVTENFVGIPCNLLAARQCPQIEESAQGLACYASCLSFHVDCCCPTKDSIPSRPPSTRPPKEPVTTSPPEEFVTKPPKVSRTKKPKEIRTKKPKEKRTRAPKEISTKKPKEINTKKPK